MCRKIRRAFPLALIAFGPLAGEEPPLREQALGALRKAAGYFQSEVATEGGYLWRYSADLAAREGEGAASPTLVWVQPPGTPAVGLALLAAFEATGDRFHLEAARDAARCLVRGQLRSGGWTYSIEFDPAKRRRFAYRTDPPGPRQRNTSTLDDDTTQSALRLLARVDRALEFKDAAIHEATSYALEALLKAQLPSGGFPQGFDGPTGAAEHAVRAASIPEDWPRTHPSGVEYWRFATLNDDLLADVVAVLGEAGRVYGDPRFAEAAERVGEFLVRAQLPEPQPGWAQQYDAAMHPAWARKFEPPAVTGGESQGALETLLELYAATGNRRFLEPVPRALAYFKRSLLPDGRLSRFYELGTNRPLYLTRGYQLTHRDDDLPTHYSFKVGSRLDRIEREYRRLRDLPQAELARAPSPARPRSSDEAAEAARRAIASLDGRGRWVERGRLKTQGGADGEVIDCRTFIRNVEALCRYLHH